MAAVPANLETTFDELNATRYMSAVGLIVLLYDHVLTFGDEVQYIWSAPSTYAKYIFLLNRYTVLGVLIAVAYETCGFAGTAFTDVVRVLCKQFIFTCSLVAIVSVGIANLLTLQRVVILWDHRPIILKIMAVGFVISFAAQVTFMIYTLVTLLPYISWNSAAGMCILTKSSPILIAVWVSPILFELFVLGSTALNALDRPRTMELHIHRALQEDGIQFFVYISLFRVLNIVFAAIGRPSVAFLAVFFIWAMTTTILGRLLLHLRRTECRPPALDPSSDEFDPGLASPDALAEEWDRRRSRAISPFGLIPLMKRVSAGSDGHPHRNALGHARTQSEAESFDDVLHIAPPGYHYRKRTNDPHLRPWD